jgi:hypothetical protein
MFRTDGRYGAIEIDDIFLVNEQFKDKIDSLYTTYSVYMYSYKQKKNSKKPIYIC